MCYVQGSSPTGGIPLNDPVKDAVQRQFGAHAASYVTSAVHARGDDLIRLPHLAALDGTQQVLDVATATGHTAFALAPYAREVIGLDITPEMLDEARRVARKRGAANVTFVEGDAERLPFPAARFDVVACRVAAHHFPHVGAFCREAARVLRPGGRLVVVDSVVPADIALDRFFNRLEVLRDPSHFRDHTIPEWERYITDAGLSFALAERFLVPLDREDWLARMGTPEPAAGEVRRMLREAPEEVRQAFAITDTHFSLHRAILIGHKAP